MFDRWTGPIAQLTKIIFGWVREGVPTEDIQKRLAEPHGVAADLLTRAARRQDRGRQLLKRDPQ